ncbi:MAG: XrtA system polysaccharide deacetylase [Pseudomonadota bacterium]
MISNALTVDVEDYYQVSAFSDIVDYADWDRLESRVERNTFRMLELFADADVKATFFVLGWVASRHPHIVREIAAQGHEVACHGYSHRLIYQQDPVEFHRETRASKELLEDQAQTAVLGYRAASYSITKKSLWALDILHECGFAYDSSIFPIRHDRYGIPDAEPLPHKELTPNGAVLVEFPVTALDLRLMKLPLGGGGYFRLFPYWLTRTGLKWVNGRQSSPFIFYLHPWEIDVDQPRLQGSWFSRFRHYNNLHRCESRLKALLKDFSFQPARCVLEDLGLLAAPSSRH